MWKILIDGEVEATAVDGDLAASMFKSYCATRTQKCIVELRNPSDEVIASVTCEPSPVVAQPQVDPAPEVAPGAPTEEGEVDAGLAEPPLDPGLLDSDEPPPTG
jgi:hypothetical protein